LALVCLGIAGYLPSLQGDALEITAAFATNGTATEFGLDLRGVCIQPFEARHRTVLTAQLTPLIRAL